MNKEANEAYLRAERLYEVVINMERAGPRNDPFFYCSARCMQCIFYACFFLFHFNFGRSTYFKYSHTTG